MGFGIEAAVGSAWIADNQGKNGITVKAVSAGDGMGGGAVNGRRMIGAIGEMVSGDSCGEDLYMMIVMDFSDKESSKAARCLIFLQIIMESDG